MLLLEGVPEFRRRVGETERDFMHRVDCETHAVIQEAKFNDKYDQVSAGLYLVYTCICT